MQKAVVSKTHHLKKRLKNNKGQILKIVGMLSTIATPVLAIKSTINAVKAVDERKKELGVEKLPGVEIVKTTWKYYIPVIITTATSVTCSVKLDNLHAKESAALSALCASAEQTIQELRAKAIEEVGEEKANEIIGKAEAKKVEERVADNDIYIHNKGGGSTMFYEPITGAMFYSTPDRVRRALNVLTSEMQSDFTVNVNDLLRLLDLPEVDCGDYIGWNGEMTRVIEVRTFIAGKIDNWEEIPYLIIDYNVAPKVGYNEF